MYRFIPRTAQGLVLFGTMMLPVAASAQLEANLGALEGDNARGYLQPLAGALSSTLNASVFQSGYVPTNQFTFQIQGNVMGVEFDDDDRSYQPADPTGFQSQDDGFTAPTVIGDTLSVAQNGQGGATLFHPGGFDLETFTVAAPQLTIGGFYGTQALVRWISIDLGDSDLGELELLGVGAQHSISQYMGPVPPVDLAIGVMFQSFKIGDGLVDAQTYQVNVTGSKRFSVFEPYLGLGYDSFDMESEYDATDDTRVSVDFDPENAFHFTAGGRLNFQFVRLHAEFNVAAETGFAAGLSVGI